MTKPGHSEAEDSMENTLKWIVIIVATVLGLLGWGVYELIMYFVRATHG